MNRGLGSSSNDDLVLETRKVWDSNPPAEIITQDDALNLFQPAGTSNFQFTNLIDNGNIIVGVKGGTLSYSSTDGITWVLRTLPATGTWSGIAWNGTVFCTVSSTSGTDAATSTDGITWVLRTLPATTTWFSITWNGTVFLATSNATTTTAATSTDGISWVLRTMPSSAAWSGVCWIGTVFVARVSASTTSATSTDGVTWIIRTNATTMGATMAWNGSVLCNTGMVRTCTLTTDGITWIQVDMGLKRHVSALAAIGWNGKFFLTVISSSEYTYTRYCAVSTDGTTWVSRRMPNYGSWSTVIARGETFIVGTSDAGGIAISNFDATELVINNKKSLHNGALGTVKHIKKLVKTKAWDQVSTKVIAKTAAFNGNKIHLGSNWRGVTWGAGVFVARINGTSSSVATSPDGITWTSRTMPVTASWRYGCWNGTVFCLIASASGTTAATSTDGITWTLRTLPTSQGWGEIAWNGNVFCVVPSVSSSTAATSTDGITWVNRTMSTSQPWHGIAWNGTVFCAVPYDATTAATSTDGITWNVSTMPEYGRYKIAWNGSIFYAVHGMTSNNSGTAAASTDGTSWEYRLLPYIGSWQDIIGSEGRFLVNNFRASGIYPISIFSTDGLTWGIRVLNVGSGYSSGAWNGKYYCLVSSNSSTYDSAISLPEAIEISYE